MYFLTIYTPFGQTVVSCEKYHLSRDLTTICALNSRTYLKRVLREIGFKIGRRCSTYAEFSTFLLVETKMLKYIDFDKQCLADIGLKMPRCTKKYISAVEELSGLYLVSPYLIHVEAAKKGTNSLYQKLNQKGCHWNSKAQKWEWGSFSISGIPNN